MKQVDGLRDLSDYDGKESVYVGRSVPITAGGALEIPIQVGTPGSVVEYAVENKQYDFGFSITAERDDSVTIVKVRKAQAKDSKIICRNSLFPFRDKKFIDHGVMPCAVFSCIWFSSLSLHYLSKLICIDCLVNTTYLILHSIVPYH